MNKQIFSNKRFIGTTVGVFVILMVAAGFFFLRGDKLIPTRLQLGQVSSLTDDQSKTVGENKRSADVRINSADSAGRYQSQAVISLTPQQEPSINVSFYKDYRNGKIDNLKIDVYKITKNDLLNFLSYTKNKDDQFVSKTLNANTFQKITSLNFDSYNFDKNILLPLTGSGLWMIRATVNNNEFNDAIIIRADVGSVVKEENNQYLFWTQNITNGKRLPTGFIEIYNLENEVKRLDFRVINNNGIATSPIKEEADVAIVNSIAGEIALIPLNIPQSWYYRYDRFTNKEIATKYYLFTDRPLYKPGDTLYFKSIIRNDDDAVYSIPSGNARVRIFYGWEQENPLFEKTYELTFDGTVSGEYVLPATARTGRYQIEIAESGENDREYWLRTVQEFYVEYFRKPEYTLDSHVKNLEIIRGDKAEFRVDGAYFFGQPLVNQTIETELRTSSFYDYGYEINEDDLQDRFQYGYWYGSRLANEQLTLNNNGQAVYLYDTSNLQKPTSYGYYDESYSQVLTLEAGFNDESGNRVVTTANVLVRDGEYSIFRKDRFYSLPAGQPKDLAIIIKSHTDVPVSNIELTGSIKQTYWERTDSNGRFNYNKVEKNINSFTLLTDKNGEAVIPFTPERDGSYDFSIEGKDRRGNIIKKTFHIWVYDRTGYTYFDTPDVSAYNLSIKTDKEKYLPSETAKLTIISDQSDRDVLLTVERDRVRRYYIVSLSGFTTEFPLPFLSSDLPNVFVSVSGFSPTGFANASEKLNLSTDEKKINIDILYSQETYAPGETVKATIKTTDYQNNPISADVAVWTVDKALYELMSDRRDPIFDFFWKERFNGTTLAHSLEGIHSLPAAEKGGCFLKGTQILVPDGSKPIEDIRAGDIILTRKNSNSNELVEAAVTQTFSHLVDGYLIINGSLRVTPEHRIWTLNGWKNAGDIQIGDTLSDISGGAITVTSIEWQKGQFEVYNLAVKDYSTYFAGGVWVHNQKDGGGGARTVFKDVAYWNPRVRTNAQGVATVSFTLPDNLTTWVINAVGVTWNTKVGENLEEFIVTKPVIVRPILPNYVRTGDAIELSSLVYNYTSADSDFTAACSLSGQNTENRFNISRNNFSQFKLPLFTFETADEAAVFRCSAESLLTGDKDVIELPFPVRKFGFLEQRAMMGQGNKEYILSLNPDSDISLSSLTVSLTPSIFGTLPQAMKYLIQYPYGCVEQTTSRFVPVVIAKENKNLFADFLKDKNLDEMIDKGIERLVDLKGSKGGWGWWHDTDVNPFITAYVTEYLLRAQKLGHEIPASVFEEVEAWAEQRIENKSIGKEEKVAVVYILKLFNSAKGKEIIADFEGFSPDVLAFAVLVNTVNGNFNADTNGVKTLIEKGKRQGEEIFWEAGRNDFFGSKDASTALALRALVAAKDFETAQKVVQHFSQNRQDRFWSNTFATAQVLEALTSFAKTTSLDTATIAYRLLLNDKEIKKDVISRPLDSINIPIDLKNAGRELKINVEVEGKGPLYSTVLIDEYRTDRNLKAADNGLSVYREYHGDFVPGETVEVVITVSGSREDNAYLVVEDYLPAGLIPVNTRLENESTAGTRNVYYGDYYPSGLDIKDDGVVFGYRWWHGSLLTLKYKARVVSRGEFTAPPAVASLMYEPQINGRSAIHTIQVSDKKTDAGVIKTSDPEQEKLFIEEKLSPSSGSQKKMPSLWIVLILVVLGASFAVYDKYRKYKKMRNEKP